MLVLLLLAEVLQIKSVAGFTTNWKKAGRPSKSNFYAHINTSFLI